MAKGHGKGSAFERDICKILSRWWTDNKRDDVFWRSTTSGARATTRRKVGQDTFGQHGDIQATDPIGQPLMDLCTIEMKRGYGSSTIGDVLDAPLKAAEQNWERWARQSHEEHLAARTEGWMLITKRDRRETLIFMPSWLHGVIQHYEASLQLTRPSVWLRTSDERGSGETSGLRVFGTTLTQFIELVSPDSIEKAARSHRRRKLETNE